MVYPDGSSYDGKLKDDERHGFGIYRLGRVQREVLFLRYLVLFHEICNE